jgi:hypothetical protein
MRLKSRRDSRADSRAIFNALEAWIRDKSCAPHGVTKDGMFVVESVAFAFGPGGR